MDRFRPLRNLKALRPLASVALVALMLALTIGFLSGTLLDGLSLRTFRAAPPPLKGMALGTFNPDPAHPYDQELNEIHALGTNAVLLMVPWYQKDIRSDEMEPHWSSSTGGTTISDARLKELISSIHQKGMLVLLMPYLRFDQREGKEWRGVLQPSHLARWKENYGKFILHYARLARQTGAEYLAVGSELGSMETEAAFWKDLIARVRKVYGGALLYSANWDHYTTPVFWDDLDAIGITAYHRLTDEDQPRLAQLKNSLKESKQQVLEFQKRHPGKKLIITEVGFPSLTGASRDPWNYFADSSPNPKEQALCYRAFIETWNDTAQLEGVFWWVWYGPGGLGDKSYTPRGKPAAHLLKQWYSGFSQENI